MLGKILIKKNYFFVILIFIVLQLIIFLKQPIFWWDEAVYVGMGKFIYSLGNIGLWEPFRSIPLPIIIGLFWKLGLDLFIFGKILALSFSIATIYLLYLIGNKIFNKNIALIAASLLAFTPIFFSNSLKILTDISSTFFVLLAIYLFINEKIFYSGIAASISFLFRFPQAIIIPILFSILLYEKRIKSCYKFVMGCFPIAVYFVLNYLAYNSFFLPLKYFSQIAYGEYFWLYNLGYSYYFIDLFKQNYLFIFSIFGFYVYLKNKKFDRKINIILLSFIIFILFFTFLGHMESRYSIIFLPYLALISAYGVVKASYFISKRKYFNYAFIFFAILLFIFSALIKDFAYLNSVDKEQSPFGRYLKTDKPSVNILTTFAIKEKQFELNKTNYGILTADPRVVLYSDNYFIPIYYNLSYAINTYESHKENVSFIIYSPESFPCKDEICMQDRDEFYKKLNEENKLVYQANDLYIFKH